MSRNSMRATTSGGLNVEVVAGWDRPLSRLFCSVMVLDNIEEDTELSELAEDQLDFMAMMGVQAPSSPRDVAFALKKLGIEAPAAMLQALQSDMDENAGNVIRVFDEAGQLQSETRV